MRENILFERKETQFSFMRSFKSISIYIIGWARRNHDDTHFMLIRNMFIKNLVSFSTTVNITGTRFSITRFSARSFLHIIIRAALD